jgi:hypothetical protein
MSVYKMPVSEHEFTVRKVSPMLAMEVDRAFPVPQPPMQEVDYGDGRKRMEANFAHPEYQAALAARQQKIQEKVQALIIKRGVVMTLTDEQKLEVADLRSWWKDEMGKELDGDDVYVWTCHIAIEDEKDMTGLMGAIMSVSQPTQEAIDKAKNMFPGTV